jgi:hypothetical protein
MQSSPTVTNEGTSRPFSPLNRFREGLHESDSSAVDRMAAQMAHR